jgi:predicted O-methyltransferase YrrM
MSPLNKINTVLKAFFEIAKNPSLLNKIIADDSVWQNRLNKKYTGLENGFPVINLTTLSPNLDETIEIFSFLGGGSLPTDIALLQILAKKFKDCFYFEIGTWRGESIVNIANHAKIKKTLNLSKADILSLKLSEKYADLHGIFSKPNKNILHLEGNSFDFDFSRLNQKFDLIFIDGDHSYAGVKNDTEKVFAHLIHDKSIIVWHDYAYNPETLRPEVILAILDGTPEEFKKNLFYVSNTMCAIFYREPIETYQFESPIIPDKTFKVNIVAKKI